MPNNLQNQMQNEIAGPAIRKVLKLSKQKRAEFSIKHGALLNRGPIKGCRCLKVGGLSAPPFLSFSFHWCRNGRPASLTQRECNLFWDLFWDPLCSYILLAQDTFFFPWDWYFQYLRSEKCSPSHPHLLHIKLNWLFWKGTPRWEKNQAYFLLRPMPGLTRRY